MTAAETPAHSSGVAVRVAPEDLAFVREVYRQLGPGGEFGWRDAVALLERRPELAEINRHIRQKEAREG